MRRMVALLAGSLLSAAALSAAPCAPSQTTLCLNDSRFEVEVSWRDSRGRTGVGQAKTITADTGYFWFFAEANIELVIKVLDARSINQKYWVFFGALTSVEFDLTVKDTVTGAEKTYHNPLGQFASVGDTGAFDPGVSAPSREIVRVAGDATVPRSIEALQAFIDAPSASAAFTPCPEAPFGFKLNGCRFHLHVEWKDSRGREGVGQPVQLTNDTGYYWFFSPDNVELMVKVLDARAIGGKFWVFFGALSNVEYTMTVTDTVTGNVRRYTNPAGRFASVGDTGAFRSGLAVAPVRDSATAASADIGPEGGILTATGADGSRFLLEVPADAVSGPTTITMTPVSRIDGMPFSGGLIAGVDLEPEGMHLLVTATLTIEPASPQAVDRTLPYAYRSRGQDFMLYPREGDASVLELPVFHFSGYGAGSGHAAEANNDTAPSGPLDPYLQEVAVSRMREVSGVITHEQFVEDVVNITNRAFQERVIPDLEAARDSCQMAEIKAAAIIGLELVRFIERFELANDPRLESITGEVNNLCIEILKGCQLKAFERCVSRNDPYEMALMVFIAKQLQFRGVEDPELTTFIEGGVLESCLRFELDFESKFVGEAAGLTERLKFRSAHVPLRIQAYGNPYARSTAWDGGCSLLPVLAEVDPPDAACRVTCLPSTSGTSVFALTFDGLADFDPSNTKVVMFYDPGAPFVAAEVVCPPDPPSPVSIVQFAEFFLAFHGIERVENYYQASGYFAKNWTLLRSGPGPSQNGEFFAKKSYERSFGGAANLSEETWLFLKHTPTKPRSDDCP